MNKQNRLSFCALFLAIGVFGPACQSNNTQTTSEKTSPYVDLVAQRADHLLQDSVIHAVSIGIYKKGQVYTAHFGELDPGQNNPPTDETIYEIASVTKSVTGLLIAQAIVEEKITLDEDVRTYLDGDYPNLQFEGQAITLRHLLTHTAGLPRFLPESINPLFDNIDPELPNRIHAIIEAYSQAQFLQDLATVELTQAPGTEYAYSNSGVDLLGHILENVFEQPYETLVKTYLTDKAAMSDTRLRLTPVQEARLANGYGEINNPVPFFPNTLWGAAGGLKSTVPDLMRYVQFQLDESNPAVKKSHEALNPEEDEHDMYLWHAFEDSTAGLFYRIHGGAFGTQNFFVVMPEQQAGFSIITNQSGPNTAPLLWEAAMPFLAAIAKD